MSWVSKSPQRNWTSIQYLLLVVPSKTSLFCCYCLALSLGDMSVQLTSVTRDGRAMFHWMAYFRTQQSHKQGPTNLICREQQYIRARPGRRIRTQIQMTIWIQYTIHSRVHFVAFSGVDCLLLHGLDLESLQFLVENLTLQRHRQDKLKGTILWALTRSITTLREGSTQR